MSHPIHKIRGERARAQEPERKNGQKRPLQLLFGRQSEINLPMINQIEFFNTKTCKLRFQRYTIVFMLKCQKQCWGGILTKKELRKLICDVKTEVIKIEREKTCCSKVHAPTLSHPPFLDTMAGRIFFSHGLPNITFNLKLLTHTNSDFAMLTPRNKHWTL